MSDDKGQSIQRIITELQFALGFLGLKNPEKTGDVSRDYAKRLYKQITKLLGKKTDITVISHVINGEVKIHTRIG